MPALSQGRSLVSVFNVARQTFVDDYCEGLSDVPFTRCMAFIEAERAVTLGEQIALAMHAYYPAKADEYLVLFTENMESVEGAWPGLVALAAGRLALSRVAQNQMEEAA